MITLKRVEEVPNWCFLLVGLEKIHVVNAIIYLSLGKFLDERKRERSISVFELNQRKHKKEKEKIKREKKRSKPEIAKVSGL